ncbi:universal stress protein [Nonomuraea zeae]|uniref:Universal stress protein n=1 Tax=Nonomuraea zeae TaxID=1642303 RepID=A0A5S4GJ56_9ACTN|nr:universal stress protein [Nonomuraea zeae]TMR32978.1 universal stress protein [Nonomuraea zeae]
MTRTIVVGIDGSPASYAALDWAADDAARRRLGVRIVHVRGPWTAEHSLTAAGDHQTLTEQCDAMLRAAASRAQQRRPGLEVTTALGVGAVAERLKHEARSADTVALGSRGLGRVSGQVLGSVGPALTGQLSCPLVIVHEPAQQPYGEVVAGFDGSADAEAALEYALEQAQARDARLRVLYGLQAPVQTPHPVGYGPIPNGITEQEIEQRLTTWRQKYPEVEMVVSVLAGNPVTVLARASRQADLVVVGSRGLGGFASAVLGSVSRGILRRARCPVAVIRRPDRTS